MERGGCARQEGGVVSGWISCILAVLVLPAVVAEEECCVMNRTMRAFAIVVLLAAIIVLVFNLQQRRTIESGADPQQSDVSAPELGSTAGGGAARVFDQRGAAEQIEFTAAPSGFVLEMIQEQDEVDRYTRSLYAVNEHGWTMSEVGATRWVIREDILYFSDSFSKRLIKRDAPFHVLPAWVHLDSDQGYEQILAKEIVGGERWAQYNVRLPVVRAARLREAIGLGIATPLGKRHLCGEEASGFSVPAEIVDASQEGQYRVWFTVRGGVRLVREERLEGKLPKTRRCSSLTFGGGDDKQRFAVDEWDVLPVDDLRVMDVADKIRPVTSGTELTLEHAFHVWRQLDSVDPSGEIGDSYTGAATYLEFSDDGRPFRVVIAVAESRLPFQSLIWDRATKSRADGTPQVLDSTEPFIDRQRGQAVYLAANVRPDDGIAAVFMTDLDVGAIPDGQRWWSAMQRSIDVDGLMAIHTDLSILDPSTETDESIE